MQECTWSLVHNSPDAIIMSSCDVSRQFNCCSRTPSQGLISASSEPEDIHSMIRAHCVNNPGEDLRRLCKATGEDRDQAPIRKMRSYTIFIGHHIAMPGDRQLLIVKPVTMHPEIAPSVVQHS